METIQRDLTTDPKDRFLKNRPWIMRMQWNDLCFLHWPLSAETLARHIPDGLQLDTYVGEAWLGITPFWMSNVRPRWTPPIPGLSTFPELNVRTYVSRDGKPGIWFFSLDAASTFAVTAARTAYMLPYFRARMSIEARNGNFEYSSIRRDGSSAARFEAIYAPVGEVFHAEPGSIEYFLTERYCLYTADRDNRIYRGDIQHVPWPLQTAEVQIEANTMTQPLDISLPRRPSLVHYAKTLDVRAWYLEKVSQ